jgi:hypothetical protein
MNSYATLTNFGCPGFKEATEDTNNPLTYCVSNNMNQLFLHGSGAVTLSPESRECQLFMSDYCAQGWDGYCEVANMNKQTITPDEMNYSGNSNGLFLTAGEKLVKNTASRKYLVDMLYGTKKYQYFDPNVPNTAVINYWEPDVYGHPETMVPIYAVRADDVDADPVMDKLLNKPEIAPEILVGIYNTMKVTGRLDELNGTKLGYFFKNNTYFQSLNKA